MGRRCAFGQPSGREPGDAFERRAASYRFAVMRRRLLVVLGLAGLVAGGTALAQGGGSDPYDLPEPKVHDAEVLKLAGASGCDRDGRLRVRFTPPPGAVFGWFTVEVRGREAVRMTGVSRAASATVSLPHGRSTVRAAGETLGGQRVVSSRAYRTCEAPSRPPAPPASAQPIQVGGGED